MKEIIILEDIVGINKEGVECHPYQHVIGDKKGFYCANPLSGSRGFKAYTEDSLRAAIEAGEFTKNGTVRMLPKNAKTITNTTGLSVVSYKGKKLRR